MQVQRRRKEVSRCVPSTAVRPNLRQWRPSLHEARSCAGRSTVHHRLQLDRCSALLHNYSGMSVGCDEQQSLDVVAPEGLALLLCCYFVRIVLRHYKLPDVRIVTRLSRVAIFLLCKQLSNTDCLTTRALYEQSNRALAIELCT